MILSGKALETHCHDKFHFKHFYFFHLFVPSLFLTLPTDFDANNIFKAFFGGPGGFSFEGGYACCSWEAPVRQLFDGGRGGLMSGGS